MTDSDISGSDYRLTERFDQRWDMHVLRHRDSATIHENNYGARLHGHLSIPHEYNGNNSAFDVSVKNDHIDDEGSAVNKGLHPA